MVATDEGVEITDIWTTREGFEKFAQEKFVPVTQEVGISPPTSVEFLEVRNDNGAGSTSTSSALVGLGRRPIALRAHRKAIRDCGGRKHLNVGTSDAGQRRYGCRAAGVHLRCHRSEEGKKSQHLRAWGCCVSEGRSSLRVHRCSRAVCSCGPRDFSVTSSALWCGVIPRRHAYSG